MIPGKHPSEEVQHKTIDVILKKIEYTATNESVVLFFDPMHQVHNNENSYCWQFKGKNKTKIVMSNTGRRRLNIVGAINATSLKPTIIMTESNCNKELIMEYIKHLKEEYKDKKQITIILDNASYNRAYEVQDYAAENQIELLYLPPYAPNLNLIERLWRFFKKKVMKNKYYKDYNEFENQVTSFFENFESYNAEISKLLTLNFGIIKAS